MQPPGAPRRRSRTAGGPRATRTIDAASGTSSGAVISCKMIPPLRPLRLHLRWDGTGRATMRGTTLLVLMASAVVLGLGTPAPAWAEWRNPGGAHLRRQRNAAAAHLVRSANGNEGLRSDRRRSRRSGSQGAEANLRSLGRLRHPRLGDADGRPSPRRPERREAPRVQRSLSAHRQTSVLLQAICAGCRARRRRRRTRR